MEYFENINKSSEFTQLQIQALFDFKKRIVSMKLFIYEALYRDLFPMSRFTAITLGCIYWIFLEMPSLGESETNSSLV